MSHRSDRWENADRWDDGDLPEDSEKAGEPKLVSEVIDARRHHHVYVFYRRNAFETIRRINRHLADGRLTFDEARQLRRQVTEACGLAG